MQSVNQWFPDFSVRCHLLVFNNHGGHAEARHGRARGGDAIQNFRRRFIMYMLGLGGYLFVCVRHAVPLALQAFLSASRAFLSLRSSVGTCGL